MAKILNKAKKFLRYVSFFEKCKQTAVKNVNKYFVYSDTFWLYPHLVANDIFLVMTIFKK